MAENVWEQWPVSKNFLTDLESNTKILSILRIGEFNLISFEVLLNRIFIISLNVFLSFLNLSRYTEVYIHPTVNMFKLNVN